MKTDNKKRGLIPVLRREIKRIFSHPSFVMMTVILPLLMFFLFISMFDEGVPRDIPIGIYDADNSSLTREIVRRLEAVPSIKIHTGVNSLEEGKTLLRKEEIYSLLYFKKNLSKDVDRGLSPKVVNFYNNENLMIGGTIYRDVTMTIRDFSSEILTDRLLKKGMSASQALAMSEPIKINTHVLFNPYTNYMYYLVSSLLPTMLHFFVILCSIYSIGIEIKKGTIGEAYELGNRSVITVLTGKLLPYTAIFSLLGMFMLTLFFRYLEFPMKGNMAIVVVSTFLLILSYQAVAMLFIAISGRLLSAMLSASFYASTAFTFIGMTFPLVSMFKPAQIWAQFLPLTHYMNIYIDQALRGSPVGISARSFFILTAFLLIPFFLIPRFKTLFTDKSKWGDWGRLS